MSLVGLSAGGTEEAPRCSQGPAEAMEVKNGGAVFQFALFVIAEEAALNVLIVFDTI